MRVFFMTSMMAAALCVFSCALQRTASAGETRHRQPVIFAGYMSLEGEIDPASVRITLDGRDVTADAQVTPIRVSYKPGKPLSPGSHSVEVAIGSGDNAAIQSWTFIVTEGDEGDIHVFVPRSLTVIFYPLPTPSAERAHTIRGVTLPGARVDLLVNGATYDSVTAQANGAFSFPFVQLEEGRNNVSATANLPGTGEKSPLRQLRPDPVVDTRGPEVLTLFPKRGSRAFLRDLRVGAEYADPGGVGVDPSRVTLWLDGRDATRDAVVTASRLWLELPASLKPGRHVVDLEVLDLVGNGSAPASTFFVVQEDPADKAQKDDRDPGQERGGDDGPADDPGTSDSTDDGAEVEPNGDPYEHPRGDGPQPDSDPTDDPDETPDTDPVGDSYERPRGDGPQPDSDPSGSSDENPDEDPDESDDEGDDESGDRRTGSARSGSSQTGRRIPGFFAAAPVITRPLSGSKVGQPWIGLQGSAGADTRVFALINGRRRSSEMTDRSGRFRFPRLPLDMGENSITVEIRDPALGVFSSEPVVVHVGRATNGPVRPRIVTPLRGAILRGDRITVTGDASGGAYVRLTVNGSTVAEAAVSRGGRFSFRSIYLEPGVNELQVESLDSASQPLMKSRAVTVTSEPFSLERMGKGRRPHDARREAAP